MDIHYSRFDTNFPLDKVRKTAPMIGADRIVLVSRSNRTIQGQDAIATGVTGLLDLIPEIQQIRSVG
jgi:hypothetical protein